MRRAPLLIQRIDRASDLSALEHEWRGLAAAHGTGLPFQTWEWNDAWWRWFGERRVAMRDSLYVRAFRAPDGDLVGVAPLVLVRRPGVGVPLVRGLELFGADPYVTEIRSVLADRTRELDVYRALGKHLDEHADEWDWVRWQGIREGSAAERLLREAHGVDLTRETPAYRVALDGTWESFKSSRPRNVKEALRKGYNSLKREGYAFELDVARDPSAMPAALDRFLELHAMRARADGLARHCNVFEDPASRGFFADVCKRFAARDAVRVFQLRVRGDVVASRVGFALGSTLYLYFSGYDPCWSRYSVMTTVTAEAIQYAFAHDFADVHLSTGTDESKLRWRPERETYGEGVEYARGLRGTGARWLHEALATTSGSRLERNVRQLLGRRRGASSLLRPWRRG